MGVHVLSSGRTLVTGEWVIWRGEGGVPRPWSGTVALSPPGNEERTPDPVLVVDGDAVL